MESLLTTVRGLMISSFFSCSIFIDLKIVSLLIIQFNLIKLSWNIMVLKGSLVKWFSFYLSRQIQETQAGSNISKHE